MDASSLCRPALWIALLALVGLEAWVLFAAPLPVRIIATRRPSLANQRPGPQQGVDAFYGSMTADDVARGLLALNLAPENLSLRDEQRQAISRGSRRGLELRTSLGELRMRRREVENALLEDAAALGEVAWRR